MPFLIQALDLVSEAHNSTSQALNPQEAEQRLLNVYADLRGHGFGREQVELALSTLGARAALEEDAPLEWLLLQCDPSELPKQFVCQESRGPVGLLHSARQDAPSSLPQAAQKKLEALQWQSQLDAERLRAECEAARAAAEQQANERRKNEMTAQREWILQYMAHGSESEGEGTAQGSGSDDSGIHDWELWGGVGLKEAGARRAAKQAERERGRLPREARITLLAAEFWGAKRAAAAAKARADKAGQQAVGKTIGRLKKEMAELGIGEGDLPQDADAEGPDGEEKQEEGGGAAAQPADPGKGEEGEQECGAGALPYGMVPVARETAVAEGRHDSDWSSDGGGGEGGMDFDLFGAEDGPAGLDSVDDISAGAAAAAARRAAALAALRVAGSSSARQKALKKGKPAPPPAPQVHPKAVLQQLCQRMGWPAPRFERLDAAVLGVGEGSAGAYGYAVVVDSSVRGGPNRGSKKGGKQGAAGGGGGPQTFRLPPQEDGWAKIEEAQQAAATRALWALSFSGVAGLDGPVTLQQLPPAQQELWLGWDAGGEGGGGGLR
jgi:ATP-dependent RNA helicase DHX29